MKMNCKGISELRTQIKSIKSQAELDKSMSHLKIIASNERSNPEVIQLIEEFITVSEDISDFKSLVILYGLLILQLVQQISNISRALQTLEKMQLLATEIDFKDGLAFSYSFSWYIEKIEGNHKKSANKIEKSMQLLGEILTPDPYIYHFVSYTYAVEMWLEKRNPQAAEILEKCANYFYKVGLTHSLTMSLGILIIIYQQMQNKEKSLQFIKIILGNYNLLLNMPREVRSIAHYFIGVGHKLSFNLGETEKHLLETERILKPIYKDSIYSGYYLAALSHLTTTSALQGKLGLALDQLKRAEDLLEGEITIKNLDSFNKNQIIHDFNLTKFYIQSRLRDFSIEKYQDLIQTIINNVGTHHSNAIMLSEFLLNINLTISELQDIKKLNNPSTKRVEHILDFLICQGNDDDKQALQRINALKRRPVEERMTYVEKAFADLLAAQEYYKINRFAEIYPLLKKYENQTHKIEVLELRVFMEAFIQVGAFKNGDPLGPALQYMAIKKCRNYGFSRLENRLLNYLDMQRRDIRSLAI
ncbi:MAG: hypothetical protein ACTSQ4_04170 [Candidatus Heimdallarchaeaceae archaeon]